MGLDWNPLGKPRPGQEDVYYGFLGCTSERGRWKEPPGLKYGKSFFRKSPSSDEYFAAQISPYETLAAPQVGTSRDADRWILDQYDRAPNKPATKDEWLASFSGYYAIALVDPNDGLPIYSNWGAGNHWERWSFRAEFLKDCEAVLGKELLEEAWLHHMPEQLGEYSRRLNAKAKDYAANNAVQHVLDLRDIPEMGEEHLSRPEHIAHVISSASRWAKFWSERGHGMEADY
jgi:hypothetical protein